ncbi:MAG: hypothetical protein QOE92_1271 [Chloroflexota bacterium]|jgi:hypothetical protein|nr:hypothetical protein [Chloroflexota bacterium]
MSQTPVLPQGPPAAPPSRIDRIPYKAGHPRVNIAVTLILVAVLLAFALVEAERLALF